MFRFFETLIDPVPAARQSMPPATLVRLLLALYPAGVAGAGAAMVVGLFVSLIEVSIFRYVGRSSIC